MKRTPIPKTVRFEVFKRDKFTCQYCGKSAPDVILEVDHITPVSKGGTNDIMNLVTACRDCNRGKTDRILSDDTTISKQKQQLDALQERREQLEMMVQWRKSLDDIIQDEVNAVAGIFERNTYWTPNQTNRNNFQRLIEQFGFNEVYESTQIALRTYCRGTYDGFLTAMSKIGGICYNRKKARESSA